MPSTRSVINTTVSAHTRSQLTELCERLGATQSEVISLALDRLTQSLERSSAVQAEDTEQEGMMRLSAKALNRRV